VNLDFNDNVGKMHDSAPLSDKKAVKFYYQKNQPSRNGCLMRFAFTMFGPGLEIGAPADSPATARAPVADPNAPGRPHGRLDRATAD
jgi:hypothetical protein